MTTPREHDVMLPIEGRLALSATLCVPDDATAVVLFAHGSGSSRLSPRNRHVAAVLRRTGLATLLVDLLTDTEEDHELFTRHLRYDIELLAHRLVGAARWLAAQPSTAHLAVGFFGASTGAAAALVAAANEPHLVNAVVSRGGRPDMAGGALTRVRAPTLLIVGGADHGILDQNEDAFDRLRTEKKLEVVAGATHLFEEPGALDLVATLARQWFTEHLVPSHRRWSGADLMP
jgi:putative phosphoribosyl transferase